MAQVTLKGNPVNTSGQLPAMGSTAPDFTLVKNDMSEVKLENYAGKKKVLNIFPSIDTPTCATSVRKFNEGAASTEGAVVLCVSKDLPFAQKRFCGSEGIDKVETLSAFRSSFGQDYGVTLTDSGIKDLYARAIVVLDENNKVLHTELVSEIANDPNYQQVLDVLKG